MRERSFELCVIDRCKIIWRIGILAIICTVTASLIVGEFPENAGGYIIGLGTGFALSAHNIISMVEKKLLDSWFAE